MSDRVSIIHYTSWKYDPWENYLLQTDPNDPWQVKQTRYTKMKTSAASLITVEFACTVSIW